ncbi:MAG: hypothetical protein RMJ19_06920, partial [Gemmatales bacterium]|nr:hypothetical protein [Gemmatales bacterium]MDW8175387.1 hypothetical protein [Gemmatales bacterium]
MRGTILNPRPSQLTGLACVILGVILGSWLASGWTQESPVGTGSSKPPLLPRVPAGWRVEHIAFALGNSGKVVGGPARWAVGGGLPRGFIPADQADRTYMGRTQDRLYFTDQRRHVWLLEGGEIWPIVGSDDLGEWDGTGAYARFIYTGAYGGGHSGFVANQYTAYLLDHGWLRRIAKQADGSWQVETVAGRGRPGFVLKPGTTCQSADLPPLGKGLTIDPQGRLYFAYSGGLLRAESRGEVTWWITPEQVARDMAEVYAQKWPNAKPPAVALGVGEGVNLVYHPNGDIYGWGRTFPPAWKVTSMGRFVPLVGFAPKELLVRNERWGKYDPARIEPHCPMGGG